MKNTIIPNKIVQEADNLSKETGISFRDCLEVLYKAYQGLECNYCPNLEICSPFTGGYSEDTPWGERPKKRKGGKECLMVRKSQ